LAVALYRIGQYGEALLEQQRALGAFVDVGDDTGIRDSLFNLINIRTICGDFAGARALLPELTPEMLAVPWGAFRLALVRGVLEMRSGRFAEAHRDLTDAHQRASALGTPHYVARAAAHLGELLAQMGRLQEACVHIDTALAQLETLGQPSWLAELRAISAHVRATMGDKDRARVQAGLSEEIAEQIGRLELYSETAWHLAAARGLIGDDEGAKRAAQFGAESFAEDASHMDSELASSYGRLPWNRNIAAFSKGRHVPLRIDTP
jgi:tetratricopeptide (TPR) repeat protein